MHTRWRHVLLTVATAISQAATIPNPQQFSLHQVDKNPGDLVKLLVSDQSGNLFAVANTPTASGFNTRIVKTDKSGNILASFVFGGSSLDFGNAAALDAQGNIVVVGSTTSADFPLAMPLQTTGAAFITKIDADLTTILYSTRLGVAGSEATAVTLDAAGNIFIAGETPAGFLTTPGALQTQSPTVPQVETLTNGFVVEISSVGDRMIFSTLFTGGSVDVPFQSGIGIHPVPIIAITVPRAIALDSSENVVIAGTTDATDLLITLNAYATQCACQDAFDTAGFIAKIGSSGTQLVWSTYVPGPFVAINAMALTPSGGVAIAGTAGSGFAVTPNAIQGSAHDDSGPAGFVAEFDPTGSSLVFSTFFGGEVLYSVGPNPIMEGPSALSADEQGDVWITGGSATGALPAKSGAVILGQSYLAGISPEGANLISLFTAPDGAIGNALAITPQATIAALGQTGSLLISSSTFGPSLMGIVERSAHLSAGAVCGRELVSLYGIGIGPAASQNVQVTNQEIANSLGGTQVLFDGSPAALLYAGPNQINAIVPSAVASQTTTTIQIVNSAGTIDGPTLPVAQALPQVVEDASGNAIALNQDGTLNSLGNPAAPGSIVAIWLTGAGAASSNASDDTISTALSGPQLPASVLDQAMQSLELDYDGDAPTQPSGVVQINFRLPDSPLDYSPGEYYYVQIGGVLSPPFSIY